MVLKAAEARAYQKVAFEEERAGNLAAAQPHFSSAAGRYLDAIEEAPNDPKQRIWKEEAELCLSRSEALKRRTRPRSRSEGEEDDLHWEAGLRDYVLTFRVVESTHRLEQVIGLGEAKAAARDLLDFVLASGDSSILRRHPMYRPPTGVVLVGPPGTGKTFFAEGLAGDLLSRTEGSFFKVSAAQLKSKWYGESLRIIRALFQVALEFAPAVVFIDEIDSVATRRDQLQSDVDRQLVTQFLNEIGNTGDSRGKPVFVIGATNMSRDSLDPALFRAGRIERYITVPLPDAAARELLFRKALQGEPCSDDVDFTRLARETPDWSGADIDMACRAAVSEVVREEIHRQLPQRLEMSGMLSAVEASLAQKESLQERGAPR